MISFVLTLKRLLSGLIHGYIDERLDIPIPARKEFRAWVFG